MEEKTERVRTMAQALLEQCRAMGASYREVAVAGMILVDLARTEGMNQRMIARRRIPESERMKCACGNDVSRKWNFCPNCRKPIEKISP